MKAFHYFLVALVIVAAACKKPKPLEDAGVQKRITSIREDYQGITSRYVLSFNHEAQLDSYESEDKKLVVQYTYDRGWPKTISYKMDTVTYYLSLNYSSAGMFENGLLATRWESGKIKEDSILVTKDDDGIKLNFFNGIYSCTIKDKNLMSAEFKTWFFKRKLFIKYGTEQGATFITNVVLPNDELIVPLFPSDGRYEIIFRMLLSAFSKNNVLSVNSELYTRSFSYEKDEAGRVSSATIQLSKITENGTQAIVSKLITYHY